MRRLTDSSQIEAKRANYVSINAMKNVPDHLMDSSTSTHQIKIKSDLDKEQVILNELATSQNDFKSNQSPANHIRFQSDNDDLVQVRKQPPFKHPQKPFDVVDQGYRSTNQVLKRSSHQQKNNGYAIQNQTDQRKSTMFNDKILSQSSEKYSPVQVRTMTQDVNTKSSDLKTFSRDGSRSKSELNKELRQTKQKLSLIEKRLKQLALVNRDINYSNNLLKDTIQALAHSIKDQTGLQDNIISKLDPNTKSILLDVINETPDQRKSLDDRLNPKFAQELIANSRGPAFVSRDGLIVGSARDYSRSRSPNDGSKVNKSSSHFQDRFGNKIPRKQPQNQQLSESSEDSPKISVVASQSTVQRQKKSKLDQRVLNQEEKISPRGFRKSYTFDQQNIEKYRPTPHFNTQQKFSARFDNAGPVDQSNKMYQPSKSQLYQSTQNTAASKNNAKMYQGDNRARNSSRSPDPVILKQRHKPSFDFDENQAFSDDGIDRNNLDKFEIKNRNLRTLNKSSNRISDLQKNTQKRSIKGVNVIYQHSSPSGLPNDNQQQSQKQLDNVWIVQEKYNPDNAKVRHVKVQSKSRDVSLEPHQVNDKDDSLGQVAQEKNMFQPLLMSQLFVCNSTAQRLSMCKFMINKDLQAVNTPNAIQSTAKVGQGLYARNQPSQLYATPKHQEINRLGPNPQASALNNQDQDLESLEKLSKKLTHTLKKQILRKASLMSNVFQVETPFENDVLQEMSDEDQDILNSGEQEPGTSPANERVGPIKPHESKIVNSNVKYLSQIMKIDEYNIDEEADADNIARGINMPTTPMSKRPSMNQRNQQRAFSNDPLDFETVFLIGPSQNIDQTNQLNLNRVEQGSYNFEIRSPQIQSQYENPDPIKLQLKSKSQKELAKQIEEVIRHYAMPQGVKTQQISGISQQLLSLKQRMEDQLSKLNENQIEIMREYYSGQTPYQKVKTGSSILNQQKVGTPYLVNMIKSIEDPTQERYVLITLTQDFQLQLIDNKIKGQNKYGILQTEVALAVQFEDKNFKNMELFLNQVKIEYIQQRIFYIKSILNKVQNAARSLETVLSELIRENELKNVLDQRVFLEINSRARAHCIQFLQSQNLPANTFDQQLQQFLGPALLNCFNLHEILKIFSCLLLERQILFVSDRRDLISKIMFQFRDILLHNTDFQWHYFFITCLPTILIGNLHAPFPTMIGLERQLFEFDALDEMIEQHRSAIGTPWETAGPCIIDIDQGKLYDIEYYNAVVKVRQIMEASSDTPEHRSQAREAQNKLAEIQSNQSRDDQIIIPSFLQKILNNRQLEHLQKNTQANMSIFDVNMLASELDSALKEDVLKKSQLYQEFTRQPASYKHSAGREQMYTKGTINQIGTSPARIRSIQKAKLAGFSSEELEQIKTMTNVEVIQKQILKFYDQVQFQKILNQKNVQMRRDLNKSTKDGFKRPGNDSYLLSESRNIDGIALKESELERDRNYQIAYRDYQFISKFIMTQMFVSLVESKAPNQTPSFESNI